MPTPPNFFDLYKQAKESKPKITPAMAFVKKVAEITQRKETTVRMWLFGHQVPDKLAQEALAAHFGIEAKYLFPKADNNSNSPCSTQ